MTTPVEVAHEFLMLTKDLDVAIRGTEHEAHGGWSLGGDPYEVRCACGTPVEQILEVRMPRRVLVVSRKDQHKPLLKLEVLNADMPHPGWMRFELEASAPDWEEPTVCWYRIPPEADSVELQSEVTNADVIARARR